MPTTDPWAVFSFVSIYTVYMKFARWGECYLPNLSVSVPLSTCTFSSLSQISYISCATCWEILSKNQGILFS